MNTRIGAMMLARLIFGATFTLAGHAGHGCDAGVGLPSIQAATDNPSTPDKVALGRKLFFDKHLSTDGTISCASCHIPEKAFSDHLPVANGIQAFAGNAYPSKQDDDCKAQLELPSVWVSNHSNEGSAPPTGMSAPPQLKSRANYSGSARAR